MLKPFYHKNQLEAGCDEAGRGCLAGPVFAAAVILPQDFYHPLLNDSKLISERNRDILRPIIEQEALHFAVSWVSPQMIDKINILQASFRAMHLAIARLEKKPDLLLIDGNRFKPYKKIAHQCIIKGDSKFASIAAASVLAKTYRDEAMYRLAKKFPEYGWEQNKGYGTQMHRDAIKQYGICKHHRVSFSLG